MQQMIPDIDPWKFRAFKPDECPPEVLEKLPFGEWITVYNVKNYYSSVAGRSVTILPFDIAKDIIDKAVLYNKSDLFPELRCGNTLTKKSEVMVTNDRDRACVSIITELPNKLIQVTDSKESIQYWQNTYIPMHLNYAAEYFMNNRAQQAAVPIFSRIIQPKVYYDVEENMIYNRLLPLKSGQKAFIPLYVSNFGGGLIVEADDDCIIPLGVGRCRTRDAAREWCNLNRENSGLRTYHISGLDGTYNDYTCIEFNDKTVLLNVLRDMPVRILYDMHTYRA